jgi:hypothetical protein
LTTSAIGSSVAATAESSSKAPVIAEKLTATATIASRQATTAARRESLANAEGDGGCAANASAATRVENPKGADSSPAGGAARGGG